MEFVIVEKTHFDAICFMMRNQDIQLSDTKGSLLTQILKCLNEDSDSSFVEQIQKSFLEIPNDKTY